MNVDDRVLYILSCRLCNFHLKNEFETCTNHTGSGFTIYTYQPESSCNRRQSTDRVEVPTAIPGCWGFLFFVMDSMPTSVDNVRHLEHKMAVTKSEVVAPRVLEYIGSKFHRLYLDF